MPDPCETDCSLSGERMYQGEKAPQQLLTLLNLLQTTPKLIEGGLPQFNFALVL